jgi:P-type E1-E2 ATPase
VILVACPCAAGLAVPLATWTAISRLAERGMLLKSAEGLQRLATADSVVFDKTGTLSDERLQVKEILTAPGVQQRRRALAILAEVERHSEHPVAKALRELPAEDSPVNCEVLSVRTLPAVGIEADVIVDAHSSLLRLERRENADALTIDATLDGTWIATATFTERFRQSSSEAIAALEAIGLPAAIMTGDSLAAGRNVAHLAPVTSGMTPEAKHAAARGGEGKALFVGDGVNDAAAMAASHASIAMSSGAAVAIETADATLFGDDLNVIPEAVTLSRRAVATIRSNFAWAVGYNVIGIALAAGGVLHPVALVALPTPRRVVELPRRAAGGRRQDDHGNRAAGESDLRSFSTHACLPLPGIAVKTYSMPAE